MSDVILRNTIVCVVSILLGVVLGNGTVYFFNKMPGAWLTEYGQEPDEELLNPTTQRIRSTPWKYLFSGLFIVIGIWLGIRTPLYTLPALFALWLLLMMSIADIKYKIVPDQLIMLLVIVAVGFLPYHARGVLDCIWGALIGFAVLLALAALSKMIYKKPGIGGADIKLFAALGLCTGTDGICFIFVITTFISALHMMILMIMKKAKLTDERPMVPYIAIASLLYMVFFRTLLFNFMLRI